MAPDLGVCRPIVCGSLEWSGGLAQCVMLTTCVMCIVTHKRLSINGRIPNYTNNSLTIVLYQDFSHHLNHVYSVRIICSQLRLLFWLVDFDLSLVRRLYIVPSAHLRKCLWNKWTSISMSMPRLKYRTDNKVHWIVLTTHQCQVLNMISVIDLRTKMADILPEMFCAFNWKKVNRFWPKLPGNISKNLFHWR